MSSPIPNRKFYSLVTAIFMLLLLFVPLALDAAPATFAQAKVELRQKVYHDRNTGAGGDLYCGCDWQWVGRSGGRIIASSCGSEVRAQAHRAERTEWEHVLPASSFGRQRQCWQNGGRSNCTATDPMFNIMEADMHNLSVSQGELNADRSNFNFGVLPNTPLQHGACPFKVDFRQRTAEPPNSAKGMVARINFYMHDHYGLNMSRQQQQLFMAWDKQFPPANWELERDRRIAKVMGHHNPYVTGERSWRLGQKPSGDGLKQAQTQSAKRTPVSRQQGTPLVAAIKGEVVIGNKRSGVYHLPQGCPSYDAVSPNNQEHFVSAADAEAAGFRLAGNCR